MKPIIFLFSVLVCLSFFAVGAMAQKRQKRKVVHIRSYVKKNGNHAIARYRLKR